MRTNNKGRPKKSDGDKKINRTISINKSLDDRIERLIEALNTTRSEYYETAIQKASETIHTFDFRGRVEFLNKEIEADMDDYHRRMKLLEEEAQALSRHHALSLRNKLEERERLVKLIGGLDDIERAIEQARIDMENTPRVATTNDNKLGEGVVEEIGIKYGLMKSGHTDIDLSPLLKDIASITWNENESYCDALNLLTRDFTNLKRDGTSDYIAWPENSHRNEVLRLLLDKAQWEKPPTDKMTDNQWKKIKEYLGEDDFTDGEHKIIEEE